MSQEWEGWLTRNEVIRVNRMLDRLCDLEPHSRSLRWIFKIKVRNSYISAMTLAFEIQSQILIRKSKDYAYGIWVYKVLGTWKGYYRVKNPLVSCMKLGTEARNNEYMKSHSKLTYQLSFLDVSQKVDYHAGGKWFIHGPKRHWDSWILGLGRQNDLEWKGCESIGCWTLM